MTSGETGDRPLVLDPRKMARLRPEWIRYLFVHHSGSDWRNVDAAEIHDWHLQRGWLGFGYHAAILDDQHDDHEDGTVQLGRPADRMGAHVEGMNHCSLGVVLVGHGDERAFTESQLESFVAVALEWMAIAPNLSVDRILGHCEINELVLAGGVSPAYRTTKTCPGRLNDMDTIRLRVAEALMRPPYPKPSIVQKPFAPSIPEIAR